MPKLFPFIEPKEIADLNETLGKKINSDYHGDPPESLLVIVTLKGAMLFAADLVRHITVPIEIDFVRVASYGSGTQSSGTIRLEKDIETPAAGRNILILDEIVDSGRTLAFLREHLMKTNPKSLRTCALLDKPSRREVDVKIDYLGKTVEDKFLVGYGLDYDEVYRNLPGIFILDESK